MIIFIFLQPEESSLSGKKLPKNGPRHIIGNFSLPVTEHSIIKRKCPTYAKVFYGHMPCVREWHLIKLVSYISALCSLCVSADHCRQIQEDFYVSSSWQKLWEKWQLYWRLRPKHLHLLQYDDQSMCLWHWQCLDFKVDQFLRLVLSSSSGSFNYSHRDIFWCLISVLQKEARNCVLIGEKCPKYTLLIANDHRTKQS